MDGPGLHYFIQDCPVCRRQRFAANTLGAHTIDIWWRIRDWQRKAELLMWEEGVNAKRKLSQVSADPVLPALQHDGFQAPLLVRGLLRQERNLAAGDVPGNAGGHNP